MLLIINPTPQLVRNMPCFGLIVVNMLVMNLPHKLLDAETHKISYSSAVRPSDHIHPKQEIGSRCRGDSLDF